MHHLQALSDMVVVPRCHGDRNEWDDLVDIALTWTAGCFAMVGLLDLEMDEFDLEDDDSTSLSSRVSVSFVREGLAQTCG